MLWCHKCSFAYKKEKSFDKGFYFHCLTATAGPQEPNTTQSDVALNTAENNLTE